MPAVSVIIPVYNGAAYIEKCFTHLREQSLRDLELVFVDDGSTDNSLELLKKHESGYVKVISKNNGGAGSARNIGIKNATGEYIAFLDVDDRFASADSLLLLYEQAKAHHALICGGSFKNEEREFLPGDKRVFTESGWVEFSEYQFDFGFQRFVYERNFLGAKQIEFPPYRVYEDPVFLAKAMIAAEKFYAVSDTVYLYSGAHQVNLSAEKTIDYLYGLRDNLRISANNNLPKLHYENFQRLSTQGSYYAECNLAFSSPELFKALLDANAQIDKKLLRSINIDLTDDYILPVLQTIWKSCNRYTKLRKMMFWKSFGKNKQ